MTQPKRSSLHLPVDAGLPEVVLSRGRLRRAKKDWAVRTVRILAAAEAVAPH